jgi:hypothetical protein
MLKKMMLLTMAIGALVAFAVPAVASANWTKNHQPLEENDHVFFEGPASFTNANKDGVHCELVTATVELTAGTTDAHILSFTADEPATRCDVSGLIATFGGGTRSLRKVELKKSATAQVVGEPGEETLQITNLELFNEFASGLKLTLTDSVEGLFALPNNNETISSVNLEGLATSSLGGTVTIAGNLTVTPEGVYGF